MNLRVLARFRVFRTGDRSFPASTPPPQQGIAFEQKCAHLLRAMGFTTQTTEEAGDDGKDPMPSGLLLVQCKTGRHHWASQYCEISMASPELNRPLVTSTPKTTPARPEDCARRRTSRCDLLFRRHRRTGSAPPCLREERTHDRQGAAQCLEQRHPLSQQKDAEHHGEHRQ